MLNSSFKNKLTTVLCKYITPSLPRELTLTILNYTLMAPKSIYFRNNYFAATLSCYNCNRINFFFISSDSSIKVFQCSECMTNINNEEDHELENRI